MNYIKFNLLDADMADMADGMTEEQEIERDSDLNETDEDLEKTLPCMCKADTIANIDTDVKRYLDLLTLDLLTLIQMSKDTWTQDRIPMPKLSRMFFMQKGRST